MQTAHMNKNFEVTYDELLRCQNNAGVIKTSLLIPANHIICYMGFPLVPIKGDKFIAFVRCDFCGQDDHKIENNRCGHCGGWIS